MKPECMVLVLLIGAPAFLQAQTQTHPDNQATIQWLTSLEQPDGSFAPDAAAGAAPNLRSTLAAVRALKYFGGQVRDKDKVIAYYLKFWDAREGGFGLIKIKPGIGTDPATTAMAVMGIADLGGAERQRQEIDRSLRYLAERARDFEEIRIAAAAFESVRKPCPVATQWQELILARRGPDGLYGEGDNRPRETGSSVAALLRLGAALQDKQRIIVTLRQGQRKDGGWGKAGQQSDLETCYRVMRACYMLRAAPDALALRRFLAQCRQPGGAYALQPGQKGSVQATYYAGIIQHWLDELK